MSIEKSTVPYEILFRLSENGEVSGCHRRDLEIVRDTETGQVYSEKELDPESLTGDGVSEVIGEINAGLTQTLASRDAQIVLLSSQVQAALAQIDQLSEQIENLTAQQ